LFVPMPSESSRLNRQRDGDKGRPWCAGAGSGALALGVQQASYVFLALAERVAPRVTFVPTELLAGNADLLVWEAFVSGKAKDRSADNPHIDDARRSVEEFLRRVVLGDVTTDVHDTSVLNLAAAGLLASGLSIDLAHLRTPCVVVKPPDL
jgi:hypothetical protein